MTKDQRIHFYRGSKTDSLQSWLVETKGYTSDSVKFLLGLGAVYVNDKRLSEDQAIEEHALIRVHSQPRRFAAAANIERRNILAQTADFVITEKPEGVPTHATLDNAVENLLNRIESLIGQKLYPAHRLDVETSGICLLAKSPMAQQHWQKLQRQNVLKIYTAMTEVPVALGLHIHHQIKQPRAPHQIAQSPSELTRECRLEVLACEKIKRGYQIRCRLLTGRTHQIRCQLRELGAPLLGDTLYGGSTAERLFLHATHLAFIWSEKKFEFEIKPKFS